MNKYSKTPHTGIITDKLKQQYRADTFCSCWELWPWELESHLLSSTVDSTWNAERKDKPYFQILTTCISYFSMENDEKVHSLSVYPTCEILFWREKALNMEQALHTKIFIIIVFMIVFILEKNWKPPHNRALCGYLLCFYAIPVLLCIW